MIKILVLVLVCLNMLPTVNADVTDDYFYRPFPILLVHGFNTFNGLDEDEPGTWGLRTHKSNKKEDQISTFIVGDVAANVGRTLIHSFDTDGDLQNPEDPLKFMDFWHNALIENVDRWNPREETDSYFGRNHTYVEVYSPYYYNESNDADGVSESRFRIDGAPLLDENGNSAGYDIGGIPLENGFTGGGQTQLVRIRMIQLLNEYYGDWKWVGDPTAKIKIVCHSNGGLIVSAALAEDEKYWAQGFTDRFTWWGQDPENLSTDNIRGVGFRLRDHVEQVVTIDTPFNGSPFSSQHGFKSLFTHWLVGSTVLAPLNLVPMALAIKGTNSSWAAVPMLSIFAWMAAFIETELPSIFITGGLHSPVMKDIDSESDFIKGLKGPAPTSSDGSPIPYINYIGRADRWRDKAVLVGGFVGIAAGYYSASAFFNPFNALRASMLWTSFAGWTSLAIWANNSDLCVSLKSQDMKSTFQGAKRKPIKLVNFVHTDVSVARNFIPFELESGPGIFISHVIGENQPGENEYYDIPRTVPVQVRYSMADAPVTIQNELHNFVQFKGTSDLLYPYEEWKRWSLRNGTTVDLNPNGGIPKVIVGHLDAYYMNSTKVTMRQNLNQWRPLTFYQNFGKWSSRFVDINGDGKLDNQDKSTGSMVFAELDGVVCRGENRISMRVEDKFGLYSEDVVIIKDGDALEYYESNDAGQPIQPPIFMSRPMQWDFSGGEKKQLVIGFNSQFQSENPDNRIVVESATGTLDLTRVAGSPQSGEYNVSLIPDTDQRMIKLTLSENELKREAGGVAADQNLHLELIDQGGHTSCLFIPFYVDNEAPLVKIKSPQLLQDYNGDGILDDNDKCREPITDRPSDLSCENVCEGMTNADECNLAMLTCSQLESFPAEYVRADCDGLDNDGDGIKDGQDKGEFENMRFYSPKFDALLPSRLISEPLDITFEVSDNIQRFFKSAKSLKRQIFKVQGHSFNSGTDVLVHTRNLTGAELQFGNTYSEDWMFNPYSWNNPPPDGLYSVVITAVDEADNIKEAPPAYFIVDKKNPSIDILQDWQDESGNPRFSETSQSFGLQLAPGGASGSIEQYDSEAQEVKVILHPTGKWSAAQPPSTVVPINYFDNLTVNSDGEIPPDGVGVPDGKIDPTRIFIPKEDLSISLMWFTVPIPDGLYWIEIESEDKAGNKANFGDPTKLIEINRGLVVPPLSRDILGEGENLPSENSGDTLANLTNIKPRLGGDDGAFPNTPMQGDFEVTIQILTNPEDPDALAGLMVRKDLDANETYAAILLNGSHQIVFGHRDAPRLTEKMDVVAESYTSPDVYFKVKREGGTLKFFISQDGISFTQTNNFDIGTENVHVGFFHNPNSIEEKLIRYRLDAGSAPFTGNRFPYLEDFNHHPQEATVSLEARGFSDIQNWVVDRTDIAEGFMRSTGPGDWENLSQAFSGKFGASRNITNGLKMEWRIKYPTNNTGSAWREQNKIWVSLAQGADKRYEFLFKPNRNQDNWTSYQMQLVRNDGTSKVVLGESNSHLTTPTHTWLRFKIEIHPASAAGGSGLIKVLFDNGSGTYKEYLSVADNTYTLFDSMHFQYKTGTGLQNYQVNVDDISISPR